MKNRKEPCADCPYRLDAPLAHWHAQHFHDVLESEQEGIELERSLFSCHKDANKEPREQSICAGWLFDQKRRGIPNNLSVRIKLKTSEEFKQAFDDVTDGDNEMFESAVEMCEANLEAIECGE